MTFGSDKGSDELGESKFIDSRHPFVKGSHEPNSLKSNPVR